MLETSEPCSCTASGRFYYHTLLQVLALRPGTGCLESQEESPDCPPAKLRIVGIAAGDAPLSGMTSSFVTAEQFLFKYSIHG